MDHKPVFKRDYMPNNLKRRELIKSPKTVAISPNRSLPLSEVN
jgi:hypothetical protein